MRFFVGIDSQSPHAVAAYYRARRILMAEAPLSLDTAHGQGLSARFADGPYSDQQAALLQAKLEAELPPGSVKWFGAMGRSLDPTYPIYELDLNTRVFNALMRGYGERLGNFNPSVMLVGELALMTEAEVLDYRNIGTGGVDHIKERLYAVGWCLLG